MNVNTVSQYERCLSSAEVRVSGLGLNICSAETF